MTEPGPDEVAPWTGASAHLAVQVGVPAAAAARLARPAPDLDVIVRGSQPVVSFGNELLADVATLGINPSVQEFARTGGSLLLGADARLLSTGDMDTAPAGRNLVAAYGACLSYFGRRPYDRWFDVLQRYALDPLGRSYQNSSACHLDLIQWATAPVWGGITDPDVRDSLLEADASFLTQQLDERRFKVLLLNGARVIDQVNKLGLADLEVVGSVSLGHQGKTGKLVRGRRGDTSVLGWSINLQHSSVVDANRLQVADWLRDQLDDLDLPPTPDTPGPAPYVVARGGYPTLAWAGGARHIGRSRFPALERPDFEATRAAIRTGARPWTARDWLSLWADTTGVELDEVIDVDTRAEALAICERWRTDALVADQALAVAERAAWNGPGPDDSSDGRRVPEPTWEDIDSRWDGWCQFCRTSPTQAEQLAQGLPVSEAAWITLRTLQQPWTDLDGPHRYLPWTPDDRACFVCRRSEDAAEHRSWTPSEVEANPRSLDVDDLVEWMLCAGQARHDDSDYGRWVRARYQTLRLALGVDVDLLAPRDDRISTEVAAARGHWDLLIDSLVESYAAAERLSPMYGVMEAPIELSRLLEPDFDEFKADQARVMTRLRRWTREVLTRVSPGVESASATTTCLWDAGIPLEVPEEEW